MKATLTFLGTATSTGIPVLGCDCDVCRSSDIRDKRLRCCSLLTTEEGKTILIDCGPDIRRQLLDAHNAPVDAVILTHSHYDHVGGLDDLRTLSYKNPVDIFCTADVADDIRRVMPYCFNGANYPNVPKLNLRIIEPYRPFTAAGIEIVPLTIIHGRLPITGFRMGETAYVTDASVVPAASINALKGVDALILNALRIEPNPTHMNLEEALNVIKEVAPKRAYLIHMSHQMGRHAEASLFLPEGVSFAYDRLTIEVDV